MYEALKNVNIYFLLAGAGRRGLESLNDNFPNVL